jgi:hypothetical protein
LQTKKTFKTMKTMKKNSTKNWVAATFVGLSVACAVAAQAQVNTEKLVIYENFGGVSPSENGITPEKWPAVHADSGKSGGWYLAPGAFKTTNTTDQPNAVPTPGCLKGNNNELWFHVDSLVAFRTGGATALGVTIDNATKTWLRSLTLRNGYTIGSGTPTVDARFNNLGCFPEFKSWLSYDTVVADMWKSENRKDELGYLIFGKQISSQWPEITIPARTEVLTNLTKMEVVISATRVNRYQALMVRIIHVDEEGYAASVDTLTYAVSTTPRLVSIPIKDGERVRLAFQARGDGNNNQIMDINTGLPGNTGIVEPYTHNRLAVAAGNPNVLLHMLKVYAMTPTAGYALTLNGGASATKTSGIEHDEAVTITAPATNTGSAAFAGWKIEGRPDLSEVANPLTLRVTESLTLTPVYTGDIVEVPVVNENFTSWPKYYEFDNNADNRGPLYGLIRVSGSAMYSAAPDMSVVKVPLRYGFTSSGADSVGITLHNVNVAPDRTIRAHNAPGAEKWVGYLHVFGPAASNKGYFQVDELPGISKVEVEASSYDNPTQFNRAVAVEVNGAIKRNRVLQTLYAEPIEVATDEGTPTTLVVGYGNQAYAEHFKTAAGEPDPTFSNIKTVLGAASIAVHSLKMYAKVAAPATPYYTLTIDNSGEGGSVRISPEAGNSTMHYLAGTVVTLTAAQATGYGFDGWVDGTGASLGSSPAIQVTMSESKTVKPVFAQNPSYITISVAGKGDITASPEPDTVIGNKYTFLAGVAVTLTATPTYGYKADKAQWKKESADVPAAETAQKNLISTYTIKADDLVKDANINVSFTFDSITDRVTLTVLTDTVQGKATFDVEPTSIAYPDASTIAAEFPKGVTINISTTAGYSFTIDSALNPDTRKTVALTELVLSDNTSILLTWKKLGYRLLLVQNLDDNGTVEINDPHADYSANEQANRYPSDYWVTLKINASSGYMLAAVDGGASYMMEGEDVLKVLMDADTVNVIPEFAERQEGVKLMVGENFQSAARWPKDAGTVSNAVLARANLGKEDAWPVNKTANLQSLLEDLAAYRDDEERFAADGPKNPTFAYAPYYKVKIPAATSPTGYDSVTVTVANGAPCNDCLQPKAVKRSDVSKRYLGHVTPGFLSLSASKSTWRLSAPTSAQAFADGDTTGAMIIDGMAYVEKLEIGYSSSSSPAAPSVYYNLLGDASIDAAGRFHGDVTSMTQKGALAKPNYSPYEGKYGWSASKEGMIMDQNMSVAMDGFEATQIVILPWYVKGSGEKDKFIYQPIYLHDLKIWGSAKQVDPVTPAGIADLFNTAGAANLLYFLGSTNVLKVDVPEQVKAVVLYNEMGACAGVFQGFSADNQRTVSGLKPGVYGAHIYTVEGKMHKGSFIKVNKD